jgi:hypothetical protein
MYKNKKIFVMYRALYGEQFVKESIESILDYADKVFVFWTNKPFGSVRFAEYKNELIKIPKKIDNLVERIQEIDSDKVVLTQKHYKTNINQFTLMYNRDIKPHYGDCDILMMMEVDHVFRKDQIELALNEFIETDVPCATTEQWEIWKGFKHCIPQWNDPKVPLILKKRSSIYDEVLYNIWTKENPRKRLCTMLWNIKKVGGKLPITGMHCNTEVVPYRLKARTHNFGFAWSYKLQYWKHIITLGMQIKIKDTHSNDNWLEEKWLNWDYEKNNKYLEQSIGYEFMIPKAVAYDHNELPDSIKSNLDEHIRLCYDLNITNE